MLDEFLRVWLTWAALIVGATIAAAAWAARAGHFRDQERARNLALWAWVEKEEGEGEQTAVLSPLAGEGQGGGDQARAPSPGLRPPSPAGRGETQQE